ncbi:BON domain-containing protein [Chamaesiphon minutus]|uniref:Putative periplasmic or secreted lipoprotein n=1 Tax=Chamaesiphon minutus (strain ATCC 27169 / PCC 6605) TaxID=1173020 RepID=K9UDA2_CHAP6|nr:BON domain-containing protein [Chamaesiphon minutus]AFY92396.1 putative periplasmic or secreted lipoprotein [Chamaesiphon minutus PCC 6605]
MLNVLDKTDTEIKNDVLSELKYDPSLNVTEIGVLVTDGVVTLTGYTTSFDEKLAAVHAVKRVAGVVAIADDIELHIPDANHRTDGEIAAAAAHKIAWATTIPKGSVEITVRNGWIILEGEVEWWYQKNAAEIVMRSISGVHGVSSSMSIKPNDKIPAVGMGIEAAIDRSAMLDASKIRIEIVGSKVILHGTVRTLAQREEAERIAWAAQGVFSVEDHLAVKWYPSGG